MALEKGDRLLKDLRGTGYTFSKSLRGWRLEAGLSQAKAAKLADISVKTLSEYENKKSLPTLRSLKKLSSVYDVPINDMLAYLGWELDPDDDELHPLDVSSTQQLLDRIQNIISYLDEAELKVLVAVSEAISKPMTKVIDYEEIVKKKLTGIEDPMNPPKISKSQMKKKKDIQ